MQLKFKHTKRISLQRWEIQNLYNVQHKERVGGDFFFNSKISSQKDANPKEKTKIIKTAHL